MVDHRTIGADVDAGPRAGRSYEELKALLAGMGSALVAFSGGVDSSLLLAAARDALGDRVLAVTACSPTYSDRERAGAVELARRLGARHRLIDTHEFDDPAYCANPPDRCYHCKGELFGELAALAAREGLAVVVDGSNADDRADYRPGHRAAVERGVRSPLAELGLGKADIRRLARERGLPNWDEPACACLASRIPYGEAITPERVRRVAAAEDAIRTLGFRVIRVRDHGAIARIEVEPGELPRALEPGVRAALAAACRTQGFTYVCLDLEGYRTGSLNAVLPGGGRGVAEPAGGGRT